MRVSLYLTWCMVTVTLLVMVVLTFGKPQGVGIRVNNNALFTLGAGLLITEQEQEVIDPRIEQKEQEVIDPRIEEQEQEVINPRIEEQEQEVIDPRIEQLFQMAQDKDTSGCILKMTCYIGTIPSSGLVGHAKTLHTILLSTTPKKNNLKNKTGNPLEPFMVALQHGEDGEDCDNLFPNCILTSNQLIQQFQEMKAATSVEL
ncbi:hypothetical protein Pmani_024249 [Petrolisthes manimaculis]|uniref:Uncharacterized protein n=1 Tax=Petrolisthes manimaculis TaxID=1843537 RepID=A0AAE1PAH4_9EUCA|nr:hypothetical protein Pmani_024249 [Petrolisthes manimaculis]